MPRPSPRLPVALLTFTAACSAGSEEEVLRFAWPDTGSLPVEVVRIQDGQRTRARFTLEWKRRGDLWEIERRDLQVLEMERPLEEGTPPAEAQTPGLYRELDLHGLTFPRLLVDGEGVLRDSAAWEEGVDRFTAELGAAGMTAERIADIRGALLEPAVRASALQTILGEWQLWVTSWTDYPLRPGWEEEAELAVETGIPGVVLPTTVHVRCEELREEDGRRLVRFTREIRYDEEALTLLVQGHPDLLGARNLDPDRLLAVRRTDRSEALVEAGTLLPVEARTRTLFEVLMDAADQSRQEVSEAVFRFGGPGTTDGAGGR